MSVTITFYSTKEKIPDHGQEIIYLRKVSSFDQYGFEPTTQTVAYTWISLDEEGLWDGNAAGYDPETEGIFIIGDIVEFPDGGGVRWKLVLEVDGYVFDVATDNFLWMDLEEYWECFNKQEE